MHTQTQILAVLTIVLLLGVIHVNTSLHRTRNLIHCLSRGLEKFHHMNAEWTVPNKHEHIILVIFFLNFQLTTFTMLKFEQITKNLSVLYFHQGFIEQRCEGVFRKSDLWNSIKNPDAQR